MKSSATDKNIANFNPIFRLNLIIKEKAIAFFMVGFIGFANGFGKKIVDNFNLIFRKLFNIFLVKCMIFKIGKFTFSIHKIPLEQVYNRKNPYFRRPSGMYKNYRLFVAPSSSASSLRTAIIRGWFAAFCLGIASCAHDSHLTQKEREFLDCADRCDGEILLQGGKCVCSPAPIEYAECEGCTKGIQ